MKIGKLEILVGADPEIFVQNNGSIISAHGMVKGDKANPYPVENGAVQVDGMALEFNIDPAKDEEEFVYSLTSVMATLEGMIPDYQLSDKSTAHFTEEYMSAQPHEATEIGCDPDYNAWNDGAINNKPDVNKPMRTAGGHIHVGWRKDGAVDAEHISNCLELTKQMDYYLGLASVLLDPDTERRSMYGQAGSFRPKSYGVEYRVLSNFWLKNEKMMRLMHQLTIKSIEALLSHTETYKTTYCHVPSVISSSHKGMARGVLCRVGLLPLIEEAQA